LVSKPISDGTVPVKPEFLIGRLVVSVGRVAGIFGQVSKFPQGVPIDVPVVTNQSTAMLLERATTWVGRYPQRLLLQILKLFDKLTIRPSSVGTVDVSLLLSSCSRVGVGSV